ncbi:MAG TPA: glycosyltransferase family 8 protein [Pyrinomonadaceae bacterium]
MPTTKQCNGPYQVATAATEGYLPYLACHLLTLGENGSKEVPLEITVIHRGIPIEAQRGLEALIPYPHSLRWIEPQKSLLEKIGAPLDFAACSPHYFRLLIPYLLPDHRRAIYLDADTMVLNDISSLWNTDLEGHAIAAVLDYLPCIRDAVSNWRELHVDPDAPYLNSGVLVMDLARWTSEKISLRVLKVCRENQAHLWAHGKWPQFDQYGLNVVLAGRWKALDPMWNRGTDLPQTAARIIHYLGNGKPGLATCQPVFNQLFFDVLRRTPYRDWLPVSNSEKPALVA